MREKARRYDLKKVRAAGEQESAIEFDDVRSLKFFFCFVRSYRHEIRIKMKGDLC